MTDGESFICRACNARTICTGLTVGSLSASTKSLPSCSPSLAMMLSIVLLFPTGCPFISDRNFPTRCLLEMPINMCIQLTIYLLHFSTDAPQDFHDACMVVRVFFTNLQQKRSNDPANSGDQRCDNRTPIHIRPLRPCTEYANSPRLYRSRHPKPHG